MDKEKEEVNQEEASGTENGQTVETQETGKTEDDGQQAGGQQTVTEPITVNGRQYTSMEEMAKDYTSLQQEFTKITQKAQEKGADEALKPNETDTPEMKKAKEVLRQMGVPFKEDLEKFAKEIQELRQARQSEQEQVHLQEAVKLLSDKYTGKRGEPKFDFEQIRQALIKDPTQAVYDKDGNVDLEYTYRKLNSAFWDKIPEIAPKTVKTERGAGPQGQQVRTKKDAETDEERAASATEYFKAHNKSE